MLNNTGVKKEVYGNRNQILFAVEHQVSVGVLVSEEAGVNVSGKKIVKAGTPLYGDLDDRFTPFTEGQGTFTGVLLHDVDVSTGDNNGTILIFGFVNVNRLDEDVQVKITSDVKSALPMIKFVKC